MLGRVAVSRAGWYGPAVTRVLSSSVPATRRGPLRRGLIGLGAAGLVIACVPPAETAREPMGRLPGLVTTAVPEWLPRPIFAGDPLPADPRERRLTEPRRVDPGGEAQRVAWAPAADALLVETRATGAACESVVRVDLGGGPPRGVGASGARTRLGAALPDGGVLVAEAPCAEPPERAAWSLVIVDPTSGARRPLARVEGEVTGVGTDGRSAFVAVQAGRRGRVERIALEGGSPRALLDASAATDPAVSATTATLVVLREVAGGGTQLVLASDEGGDLRPWSRGAARDGDPSISPDGRALVFASTRAAAGKATTPDEAAQLYLGRVERGEADGGPAPERLTFSGEDNRAPAIAPDGRHLAWVSDRAAPGGPRQIVVARFDGEP